MIYIIDANNLAGKLNILFEDDFDKKLVYIIKQYFSKKQINIFLIFDSADLMGDKYEDENVTVIYTPKDSYYKNADDKVVELLYEKIDNIKDEITLVTDDLEIIEKAEKIVKETGTKKVYFEKSTNFALKIENKNVRSNQEENKDTRGLSKKQISNINEELLNLWK